MKNFHIQNFLECARAAGWEVIEEDGFQAVKSPVRDAFANFVWGPAEPGLIERSRDWFGESGFTWALMEGQDGAALRQAGFQPPETVPDLVLDLDRHTCRQCPSGIRLARADSSHDFPFWAATASEALGLSGEAVRGFFLPLVREGGAVPLLAFQNGLPAATALAYCGTEALGIYAVGTRPAYRRMGLGRAATEACLALGQDVGLHRAVLSASVMGQPLYRRIGFKAERLVSEFPSRGGHGRD
ncbi:MAG: GNAT family N-acetyltransferase [Holophaga sp.]|nr:GNAT family N-acetyltransferase [Holophaga sp.]